MSWNSYIDSVIANGGGHIDKACIIGLNGSVWTSGADNILQVTPQEAMTLSSVMKPANESVDTYFAQNGVVVAGVKYMFLRSDDGYKLVLAKKTDHGAITMQCTKQAILIAHTAEGKQQGNSNKAVETIAKYLEGTGY